MQPHSPSLSTLCVSICDVTVDACACWAGKIMWLSTFPKTNLMDWRSAKPPWEGAKVYTVGRQAVLFGVWEPLRLACAVAVAVVCAGMARAFSRRV